MALTGKAMRSTGYEDLKSPNDKTAETAKMLAASSTHLAGLLKASRYPGMKRS